MAGKINAEAIKITESMWLSKNADGSRLVAYYPVTDTIELLSTETGLTTSIGLHNESDTSHADIRSLIGTTVGTHNSDGTAHSAIQDKIGTDISSHNSDETAHTAIQEKIGTDIGAHDIAEDAHGDIRTALSTHTGDSTIHLGNADKIVVDADGNISAGYSGWAGLETDGATTFVRFGTATQSYKFTVTEDGGQIQQLIDGDYIPVNTIPTASTVNSIAYGEVSYHNSSGTAHSDIRTALSTHTSDTSNPHVVTLGRLTDGTFNYDGDVTVTGDNLVLNSISYKSMNQSNISTPTTYFNQVCNAGGLPEFLRRSPTDSTPVNIGTPYFTGTHWGVASNTPVSTVKYDGTNPCGMTFRKFNQVTSNELQFGANTNNRLYMPSSSSVAVGQRYLVTCMVRLAPISGQTPPAVNLRLYMVLPAIGGQTYASGAFNTAIPAYSAAGSSLYVPLETTIDVNLATAGWVMFCLANRNGATTQNTNWPYSISYTDVQKPYFYLWASDTNLNTTWECYLADMSLYRIK